MTDFDFDLVGQFGSYGNERDNVRYPNGMCYYEHTLYVSDRGNNRIVKLTNYLKHLKSFPVDFQPSTIRILNDLACVKSMNTKTIYFYDLSFFNIKCKYDEHYGTISVINAKFYEFNCKKGKIHCYDINGDLEESCNIRPFKHDLQLGLDASIYQLGKHIIMNCPADKFLISFDFF